MHSKATMYLSKKGRKELRKDIAQLEREQTAIIAGLRDAGSSHTREERYNRIDRLESLDVIEAELADKRQLLANSKLLPSKRTALKVALGSIVDLIDTNGRVIRYQIVDSFEANPSDGRISAESPLGKQLLGRQLRDTIDWTMGRRSNSYKLVGIA